MTQGRKDNGTANPVLPTHLVEVAHQPHVTVDVSGLSDRGLNRSNNEDCFLISVLERSWRMLQTNLTPDVAPKSTNDLVYGMMVADGMGGAAGGEVASRTAVTAFIDMVLRTPNLVFRLDDTLTDALYKRITSRFESVKEALEELVRRDPSLQGMGTTMTMAWSFGADLVLGHVGDSRAYLYRQGTLQRLTRDQTMGQFLRDTGMLTDEQLEKHPMRHVLTGVLGTQGRPIDVNVRGFRLEDGDQILLCTDGLTEMLKDDQIAEVLAAPHPTSVATCRRLVDLANGYGGRDNITAVVARYKITPPKAA